MHNLWHLLDAVLVSNGLYDMCCGAAILGAPGHRLARLHADVFGPPPCPLTRRLLAYWILTYAGPRLLAGLRGRDNPVLDMLCAHTYFMEGAAYHAERGRFGTTVAGGGALFVTWASYALGAAAAARALLAA